MKIKKIPRKLYVAFLTLGASLTLGLLSFSGMFALWPVLLPALSAFVLSWAYEGEIYSQNIQSALKKLRKNDYLKGVHAKKYLQEQLQNLENLENCPQFLKDYQDQTVKVNTLAKAVHDNPKNRQLKKEKKQAKKILKDMDHWFYRQAIPDEDSKSQSAYQQELQSWLEAHEVQTLRDSYKKSWKIEQGVKLFSAINGLLMGIGTAYLLSEAIASIAFLGMLAASPVFAMPFAGLMVFLMVCSGLASAKICYNSVTDLLNHDIVDKWLRLIKEGFELKNSLRAIGIVCLLSMAALLTLCSAGTWWTIVKNTRPFFSAIARLPFFVMAVINPVITGISAVAFNLSNSYETYNELTEMAAKKRKEKGLLETVSAFFKKLTIKENLLQQFNIPRLLIKLLLGPIRILLFIGHLISIAASTDQVPKIPTIVAAIFGFISEGFEDYHYFIGGDHHHCHDFNTDKMPLDQLKAHLENDSEGHSHANDLPTQLLKIAFSPLYMLAILWDYGASQFNDNREKKQLGFIDACKKHKLFVFDYYHSKDQEETPQTEEAPLLPELSPISDDWQKEHGAYRIEHYCEKHIGQAWVGQDAAKEKVTALKALRGRVLKAENGEALSQMIQSESEKPVYNQHRWFASEQPTETKQFLSEKLAERIGVSPVA